VSTGIVIRRAGPATTVQDTGRFGMLQHGISESGPMDGMGFARCGALLGQAGAAIEFSQAGIEFTVEAEPCRAALAGGDFSLACNGVEKAWPAVLDLATGDTVSITPGSAGNYGYLRFDHELDLPAVLGSRSTNLVARLGGLEGRALRAGDRIGFVGPAAPAPAATPPEPVTGPLRFVWGIHADLFPATTREKFLAGRFVVSSRLDRMGVRLEDEDGVFAGTPILSLVSDAIVAGDIQILGDGTPIVLMRDHQPTGGYPRIGTIVSADLDRFAQMRPGSTLAFASVTLQKARELFVASVRP
jgi:biotin-dependent carboxylase-like uncharacterized protein